MPLRRPALVTRTNVATLATLSEDGSPWASLVACAVLPDSGAPVLCVSDLAEHGRNLARDPRASLVVTERVDGDPLAAGRVTLTGHVERPDDEEHDDARAAFFGAVPGAETYISFSDFTLWVLRVQRVRWVGGFGRMQTVEPEDYAAAG
jgi:putative heme iron utilization protein